MRYEGCERVIFGRESGTRELSDRVSKELFSEEFSQERNEVVMLLLLQNHSRECESIEKV